MIVYSNTVILAFAFKHFPLNIPEEIECHSYLREDKSPLFTAFFSPSLPFIEGNVSLEPWQVYSGLAGQCYSLMVIFHILELARIPWLLYFQKIWVRFQTHTSFSSVEGTCCHEVFSLTCIPTELLLEKFHSREQLQNCNFVLLWTDGVWYK